MKPAYAQKHGRAFFILRRRFMTSNKKGSIAAPLIINYQLSIVNYTIPCAIIALATFMKPATLAPFT